jgi:hypothetical protein
MARRPIEQKPVTGWTVVFFSLQVCLALGFPLALCAYMPSEALVWVGVLGIALLCFALLHGGWVWLVPLMGVLTLGSIYRDLPVPRPAYIAACAVLSVIVAALVVRGEIRAAGGVRRRQAPPPTTIPSDGPQGRSDVSVQYRDGTIVVSWLAPTSTGGVPITAYQVQASFDAGSNWAEVREVPGSQRAVAIDDLVVGRDVCFRVAAINVAGIGPPSKPTAVFTPMGPPGPPQSLCSESGDRQVRLTWSPPVNDGGYGIVDYAVRMSTDEGGTWVDVPRGASAECITSITGLTNGRTYQFEVSAMNARGRGAASPLCHATPAGLPGPPTLEGCIPGEQTITVTWLPPASNGGMPLLGYVVESSHDGGATWLLGEHPAVHSTSSTLHCLANGIPYLVRVAAVNAVGRGTTSPPSMPTVPVGLPGEVGGVEGTAPRRPHDPMPERRSQTSRSRRVLVGIGLLIALATALGLAVLRTMDTSEIHAPDSSYGPSVPADNSRLGELNPQQGQATVEAASRVTALGARSVPRTITAIADGRPCGNIDLQC